MKFKMNELYHFGTKEHSGRYPWGSGNRPKQRLEKSTRKSESSSEKTSSLIKDSMKKVAFKPIHKTIKELISNIGVDGWTKKNIIMALILNQKISDQNSHMNRHQQQMWRDQQMRWNQQTINSTMRF